RAARAQLPLPARVSRETRARLRWPSLRARRSSRSRGQRVARSRLLRMRAPQPYRPVEAPGRCWRATDPEAQRRSDLRAIRLSVRECDRAEPVRACAAAWRPATVARQRAEAVALAAPAY